jgi:CubicO group peptidase (beta-lactamase class C family)
MRRAGARALVHGALLVALGGCGGHAAPAPPPPPAATQDAASEWSPSFGPSTPEQEGMDSRVLLALTRAVHERRLPVFSILVSRHGKLVYELYTSSLGREEAHYLMSVTKSFLGTLVGIAIGEGLLPGPDASIADVLPRDLFASDEDVARFRGVTLKDVLGMSALDAPDPPRSFTPDAMFRLAAFQRSPSRVRFALTQAVLPRPGQDFQYNDVTPMLASGAVQNAVHATAFDYAVARLFQPMGFRNHEWMHQDPSSADNGGYGLRLRPIDMQKFGVLYLRHGDWNGRQLVPRAWVDLSFSPWNRSPKAREPNYGWFWWTERYGPRWTAHMASGWKGQRIAVFPDQELVVTMTGLIEDEEEHAFFSALVRQYVMPAVAGDAPRAADPEAAAELAGALDEARRDPPRFGPRTEPRMIPSAGHKEGRRPYAPLR